MYIRPLGYDFSECEVLLLAGAQLGGRQLMLAAAMNHATVPVRRKPLVAVLANGDELVQPGSALGPGQIVSSIPAGMKAAIEAWGGEAFCSNSPAMTRKALRACVAGARQARCSSDHRRRVGRRARFRPRRA